MPSNAFFPAAFGRLYVETGVVNLLERMGLPAAFGRLYVETGVVNLLERMGLPAAFGRLCVETPSSASTPFGSFQPPSGGCVLKLVRNLAAVVFDEQPPSGGCVLKQLFVHFLDYCFVQPPSGGCVLKLRVSDAVQRLFPSRLRAAVC